MTFLENKAAAERLMDAPGGLSFFIREGAGDVMFSAPHCVEQLREGRVKFAEPQTGVMVEMLHRKLGCHIIRKDANCNDDANFDPVCPYKTALEEYIRQRDVRLLVDLHQLSPERDVMVNFGTGGWKNLNDKTLLNVFLSSFSKHKLGSIQIDEPFGASYEHTVSSTIHRTCGIPCMQIELNSRLLLPQYAEYAFEAVYESLCECYHTLSKIFGGDL